LSRALYPLVAVLAVALLAAGCGDDDDEEAATGTTGATGATGEAGGEPLSKAEFIERADGICAEADKEIDEGTDQLFSGGAEPSTQETEQYVTETLIPSRQRQIDQIRALTPPEGDEDEVAAILDAAESAVDQLEQNPSLEGNNAGVFNETYLLAGDYGLRDCSGV
jgi:hypothetical protein